ncbi:hypothetical protein GCM10010201_34580 [Pilimelia columellifera subsp. columellifera]|uniref:Uncharacterized protein n=1 Tax=Pilimelia columellifera subsp. columellifera TaxID=706583 RepID=A0ABN3NSY9_9ACTN
MLAAVAPRRDPRDREGLARGQARSWEVIGAVRAGGHQQPELPEDALLPELASVTGPTDGQANPRLSTKPGRAAATSPTDK